MGVLCLVTCVERFLCIFLLGILIFKGLTAPRLYESFGVKELSFSVSQKPGDSPVPEK
jgi:hypothetical protein